MGFYRQFDNFDPLTEQPPEHPFSVLPSIVERARALLAGRSREQIVYAATTADWLINEQIDRTQAEIVRLVIEDSGWELTYLPEDERNEEGVRRLLEDWPVEADDPAPYYPTSDNISEIDTLKVCISDYSLTDDPDFPNGRDSEFFAVLALWKIADTIKWLLWNRAQAIENSATLLATPFEIPPIGLIYEGQDKEKVRATLTNALSHIDTQSLGLTDDNIRYSIAGESALEAMDAVCYAEHLKAIEELQHDRDDLQMQLFIQADPAHQMENVERLAEEMARQKISIANSKAAIKRHAENHAMKQQVFDWCTSHLSEYPSMDAAAEAIAGNLVPVKFRTARSWISDYRKREQSARRL